MRGKAQRIVGRVHPETTYAVHAWRVEGTTLAYYLVDTALERAWLDNACVASGLTEAEALALVALLRSGINNGGS